MYALNGAGLYRRMFQRGWMQDVYLIRACCRIMIKVCFSTMSC